MLIDGLPSTSRTVEAVLDDPETAPDIAAAIIRDTDADDGGPRPSLRSQTPEVGVLQDILDVLLAALGGTERVPRPETAVGRAIEELRAESVRETAREMIAVLTPWETKPDST